MKIHTAQFSHGKMPALSINLKPSVWLGVYLSLVHLSLLLAVYLLWSKAQGFDYDGVNNGLAAVMAGLLLMHWLLSVWRYGDVRAPNQVRQIVFREQGWLLVLSEREQVVELLQTTVWPWLMVMNFRDRHSGQRYSVLILPDSADPQQQRRLRVMLRHLPLWA
jgi:hypothetical protein